jgi:hypothetical protein
MSNTTQLSNPWMPNEVRNMDICGLVERIDRVIYETMTSESASLNELNSFDIQRQMDYSSTLRTYASMMNSASVMDLPHSYPHMYKIHYLTETVDVEDIKNKGLRDIIRYYLNAMVQLSRSESADKSNAFHPADYGRFLLIMDRIDQYISAYLQATLPIDFPKSSDFEKGTWLKS